MSSSSFGTWVGHNLLFSDLLESDNRSPCMTFSVPNYFLELFDIEGGNRFGLLAPRIEFWLALITSLIIGSIFSALVSCIVYHFIVVPRKNSEKQNIQSMTPFIVGFGIIMPLCIASPYYGLRYFSIKCKIIKFFAGVSQITSFFRCSEAMFGFLPSNVDDSLKKLIVYNALPVEIKFDSNGTALGSKWYDVKYYLASWVKYIVILGIYSSILQSYDYQPYPNKEGPALKDINILNGFGYNQLMNNLLATVMFQIYLTTFGLGLNFLASLLGFQLIPFMLNPMFESSSVSDFWGRRWNLVVHGMLKRGVYKPVRAKYSRFAASVTSFIASGLFHEWLLSVVFYPDSEDGTCSPICYQVGYGRNTLFFIWNAILIGLEHAISGNVLFKLFNKHLPATAISLMVASTALPMAHWFTNDYVRTDFFKDGQIGFPLIVRVD